MKEECSRCHRVRSCLNYFDDGKKLCYKCIAEAKPKKKEENKLK